MEGISHITFIVKDLTKASLFFKNIFDAEEVYSSSDKMFSIAKEKIFLIAGQWIAIMERESSYLYDFDNHLFELHTGTLEERLKRYME
jgi:catechol 2,3-dioxygenase-like lactoylglutathione lyase family enzyme